MKILRKPKWLKIKLPTGKSYISVKEIVNKNNLHTICQSGNCPNISECWGKGTATFMILGDICTRSCRFCAVKTGKPKKIDESESVKIARSVKLMKLNHIVLTSVDRDDLEDGGSIFWVKVIEEIRKLNPQITLEALIPDFNGDEKSLKRIIKVKPEIVSHNLETVRSLTKKIRVQADYDRSLQVLKILKDGGMKTKSGIMLGLGETKNEIIETMDDLRKVNCDILTIGQYLQASKKNIPVYNFPSPKEFENYKDIALKKGFKFVESSPLVRSSYGAEKHL
ncbi:MAG: lipoyl synthase [Bacteroidetes bacterium 4572_128]|nr:MAG: lipoyl synthase [Bacteroidetes bacterium 4572_128]